VRKKARKCFIYSLPKIDFEPDHPVIDHFFSIVDVAFLIYSAILFYRPTLYLASQPCVRDAIAGAVLQSPIASGGKRGGCSSFLID
jgi:hypothetical protein